MARGGPTENTDLPRGDLAQEGGQIYQQFEHQEGDLGQIQTCEKLDFYMKGTIKGEGWVDRKI